MLIDTDIKSCILETVPMRHLLEDRREYILHSFPHECKLISLLRNNYDDEKIQWKRCVKYCTSEKKRTKKYPNLEIPANEIISWLENISHTSVQVAKQGVNTRIALCYI